LKLSQPERIQLLGQITAALIPLKITNTPPASDGTWKEASKDFATACWALKYLHSLEYVLEREDAPKSGGGSGEVRKDPMPRDEAPF
jgi:hypothetical protein